MPKKNETTKKPVPGFMGLLCNRCKNTILFPVSLDRFASIKVWGMKVYLVPCDTCGDTLTLTLTP